MPLRVILEPTSSSSTDETKAIPGGGGEGGDQHPFLPWQYAGTAKLAYASQWRELGRQCDVVKSNPSETSTVFGLAFFDSYLIGCTSKGYILLWKLNLQQGNGSDSPLEQVCFNQEITFQPSIPWNIHEGATLEFITRTINSSTQFASVASSDRPILRLRLDRSAANFQPRDDDDANVTLYHCEIVERSSAGPYWLVVSGKHGTNEALEKHPRSYCLSNFSSSCASSMMLRCFHFRLDYGYSAFAHRL
jgi:hypothetical protein